MTERKLLFFDIDGTLVPGGTEDFSERVADAIKRARANGHLTFISTGRSQSMVNQRIMGIGFDGGIFSAGGRASLNGADIFNSPLPREMVDAIVQVLKNEPTVFYLLEGDADNFKGNMNRELLEKKASSIEGAGSELQRIIAMLSGSAKRDVEEYDGTPVYKVSFLSFDWEAIVRAGEKLQPYGKVVFFDNMMPDSPIRSAEISAWDNNKGIALRAICEKVGADPKDCIAFGDSMNDAEIILAAGLGIAMGNSDPELKKVADRICETVQEDGVVLEMERLGLI